MADGARWLKALGADLAPTAGAPLLPLRRPAWAAWAPHLLVAVYATILAGFAWHTLIEDFGIPNQVAAVLSIGHALSLLVALYWPMSGWWLSLAMAVASALIADPESGGGPLWPGPSLVIHLSVLVLVGLRVRPRVQAEMWLLTLLAGIALAPALPGRDGLVGVVTMALLSGAVLVAAGALRGRAEALRRLAEQEHISAEERARRALLEQRTRIARELHDVVAHHMSVIAIQAEAAPLRVPDPPRELTRSFATIRHNAVDALTELHRVLDLLRGDRENLGRDADAPQPTLDLLDGLLTGVRGAGLAATVEICGTRRRLAQGVELSAYRIVQEALSNVLRHAPGARVTVTLDYRPDRLDLHVVNGPPPGPQPDRPEQPARTRHGLVGMRERAAMLGGTLTARPQPDGGYAVRAELPTLEGEERR